MSTMGLSSLIQGLANIKWWKYKYLLGALLLLNLLVINQFFLDHSGPQYLPAINTLGHAFEMQSAREFTQLPNAEDPLIDAPVEYIPPPRPAPPSLPDPPPVAAVPEPLVPLQRPIEVVPESPVFQQHPVEVVPKPNVPPEPPAVDQAPPPPPPPIEPPTVDEPVGASPPPPPPPPTDHTPAHLAVSTNTLVPLIVQPLPSTLAHGPFNLNDYSFDGEYVGWPLKRLCDETQWVPGLTFVCDNNSGGIGNIRNFILTCIRYAIEAGATGLMMPRIQRRSDSDLANIFTGGFHEFDYFFDKEHFLNAITTNCPKMRVYNALEELPNAQQLLKVEEFFPKDLNADLDGCDGRGVNRHLDFFRVKFHGWLHHSRHTPTIEEPISIRFKWATFFEWAIYRDGPEVANTFGDLLRIRRDIQDLAATAVMQMYTFVGKEPDAEKFEVPYLGVHLRTEKDALGFWPSFDEQSDGYLQAGKSAGLKHAFLACGDPKEAKRFSDKALQRTGLLVTTKLDLLQGTSLQKLKQLSWDQQALVDFLILEKSTHFTGCSFSSFAMNIAFKRHRMTEGLTSRQWKSPGDRFSTLVGRFEHWYGDWMFMYECMWP